jgi:hypothetical protein
MRSMDRLQVQTSSGWMDIGNQLVIIIGGSGDAGTVLPMKGHTGVIRTMTTTEKAGECTRDIGTMRTTTTATGETTIMIATVVITTTITTDHDALMRVELAVLCIGGLDENPVSNAPYLCPAAPRTRS